MVFCVGGTTLASPAAAAVGPRATWCGGVAPELDLDGLLPGGQRSVQFDLCNTGDTTGTLSVTITGGAHGLVGDFIELSLGGPDHEIWSDVPLAALTGIYPDGTMTAGGSRRFTLTVKLAPAADNRVQGADLEFGVLFDLAEQGNGNGNGGTNNGSNGNGGTNDGGRASGEASGQPDGASVSVGSGAEGVTSGPVAVPAPGSRPGRILAFTGSDLLRAGLSAIGGIATGALLLALRRLGLRS